MSRRLKIIMIDKYYFIMGGSERYLFDLKALLEEHEHEVIPFAMASDENYRTPYEKHFVDNIDYQYDSTMSKVLSAPKVFGRMTYSFHAKRKIEQLLREAKPDIAHLHMIDHQISPSILHALRKHNVPVVQTVHQYKLVCPNYRFYVPRKNEICERCLSGNYFNAMIQRCHKDSLLASAMVSIETTLHKWMKIYEDNIDYFIVPSRFMGKKLAQGGVPHEKIKDIYHFIDTEKYPLSYAHKDYFVYYGRLSEEKGLFTLLKAVKAFPNARLKIIGDGPSRGELEAFARANNLSNVEFLGKKLGDELKSLVSNAMFVVLPSEWYENSPMVIYESFSMGKPIIGAMTGGITELIRDRVDGLLYKMGNVEALKKCIEYMLDHKEKIQEFGRAGRQRVETEFDPETHYNKIMTLYESLLAGRQEKQSLSVELNNEVVVS